MMLQTEAIQSTQPRIIILSLGDVNQSKKMIQMGNRKQKTLGCVRHPFMLPMASQNDINCLCENNVCKYLSAFLTIQ